MRWIGWRRRVVLTGVLLWSIISTPSAVSLPFSISSPSVAFSVSFSISIRLISIGPLRSIAHIRCLVLVLLWEIIVDKPFQLSLAVGVVAFVGGSRTLSIFKWNAYSSFFKIR